MAALPRGLSEFGVSNSSSSDQTTLIQSALDSGEPLFAEPGVYLASNLTFPTNTTLHGSGRAATIFKQLPGSTGAFMSLQNDHASFVTLSDFAIDGNKSNQVSANIGLDLSNTGNDAAHIADSTLGISGAHHKIQNLTLIRTSGTGLRVAGKGGSFFDTLFIYECNGHGAELNVADSFFSNIDNGAAGLCGFYLGGGCAENRFSNTKAWFSGQIDRTTHGQGWFLDGAFRNTFSTCDTQSTGSHGVHLKNAHYNLWSPSRIEFPPYPGVKKYGLYLVDSSYNMFSPLSVEDHTNSGWLDNWLAMEKVVGGCSQNSITANSRSAANGFTVKLLGGQNLLANHVYVAERYHLTTRQNYGYMPKFADDAAAKAGGLSGGDEYIDSALGYRRMVIT
jgi:hypothetical protein